MRTAEIERVLEQERIRSEFESRVGISIRTFIEKGSEETMFIFALGQYREVSYVRNPKTDPWIVCPKDNGGFGMSYCVHYGMMLIPESSLKDVPSEK